MSKNYCKVDHKWCKFCKKTYMGFCCHYNDNPVITKELRHCPKRTENETISFRKLLKSVNMYDVMTAMIKSHPNQKNNIVGYCKVYDNLSEKKGIKSNGMIRCTLETYDDGSCINAYGVFNHKEYACEFLPWGEWLTMNIEQETLNKFTKEEIVASCLYEMTYNGYEEDDVQDKKQAMEDSLEEYLENDKSKKI